MPCHLVRPGAWREINLQLDFLVEEAGLGASERFLNHLLESFEALAEFLDWE